MDEKQRTLGQFETPPDVADLLLGFCLRRSTDWLLDPSCGDGAFLQRAELWRQWLADSPAAAPQGRLWGVELDPDTAVSASEALPQARILNQNFFTLTPDQPFDAIIGNPPYTRAEWIGRLHRQSGEQMAFDLEKETNHQPPATSHQTKLIPRHLWQRLSHRSGLHAYFFLHGVDFLREGGRLGFVLPNGWLDVAYGAGLKQFLLDHFRIIALIESSVERWFREAKINTCLLILEKCSDSNRRSANLSRLIRLKRPLKELIRYKPDNPRRIMAIERLVPRLLPSDNRLSSTYDVRVIPQWKLDSVGKWGLALRAPDVYRRRLEGTDLPPLKSWMSVQRGYTTGANRFFYLNEAVIDQWGIEPEFRRPLLKTLRGLDKLRLTESDCQTELLWLPARSDLQGTAVADYIAWGEAQGLHRRRTCAQRQPWHALPDQPTAHLVLPKGFWRRHFAPVLTQDLPTDQQLYRVSLAAGVSPLAAAALLNSAWFALQCELQGRVNFGEGLLWLATYEFEEIILPDPRLLAPDQITTLERRFERLSKRPVGRIEQELAQTDHQALDTAVFDILKFSAGERKAVLDALLDRVQTRQRRAAVAR